jgi:hypothetical protein
MFYYNILQDVLIEIEIEICANKIFQKSSQELL